MKGNYYNHRRDLAYHLTKYVAFIARPEFLAPKSINGYAPIAHTCLRAQCSLDVDIHPDDNEPHERILIEEIKLDDTRQLQLMSEFCIDMFFNRDQRMEGETLISR
jgi:hypothetical protein